MSLWQHKNIHKKHLLWVKLFSFCFILHLIFLLWIFCIYRDNSYILSFAIHKDKDYSQPIIFVPYATQTITQPLPQKNKPTPMKNNIKTTTLAPITEKKVIETKKPTTIANTPKKIDPIKKSEPIKTTESIKTIEPIKEPVKKIESENSPVSHNYREVEALRRAAQLQKELLQKWNPPLGVSAQCICEISFFVNKMGTIEQLKMVKNSGVMMYDISARQALFAMKMPQWTYGKPLVISFKQ